MTFIKQILRAPVQLIAFMLLLSLSSSILCMATSSYIEINGQAELIRSRYITIAVPNWGFVIEEIREIKGDSTLVYQKKLDSVVAEAMKVVRELDYVTCIDERTVFSAYIPNTEALIAKDIGYLGTTIQIDKPYDIAIFVGTIKEERQDTIMEVETSISFNSSYEVPDVLKINQYLKPGKRYIICGSYVKSNGIDSAWLKIGSNEEYPLYAELLDGETIEEFLASDRGKDWKESIIPMCEITQQSVQVMTTEYLSSVLLFYTQDANIIDGRIFSQEEYENHEKVCIISSAYAVKNNLNVGDSLPMQFYDTGYFCNPFVTNYEDVWQVREYTVDIPLNPLEEYKIIGIYQSPGATLDKYTFSSNTVFIPGNTVEFTRYPYNTESENVITRVEKTQLIDSIVIQNEDVEVFQSEMERLGYQNAFLYFDQSNGSIGEGATKAMMKNALYLLILGIVLFGVASLLTTFLYSYWCNQSVRTMRFCGESQKNVTMKLLLGILGIAIPSMIVSAFMGGAFFQTFYQNVLGSERVGTYSFITIILVILVEILVICVMELIFAKKTLSRKLIGERKEL